MMGWNNGWGMMGGGWFMWLLLILLVVLVVWTFRALASGASGPTRNEPPPTERETPQAILQNRYARGEISREEYEQIRSDLEDNNDNKKN